MTAADSPTPPAERAESLSAAYVRLAADYDDLCAAVNAALSTGDAEQRRIDLSRTDSIAAALTRRSAELDSAWWGSAAEYYDRRDGSFSEFCRVSGLDSARVDIEAYRACKSANAAR